MEARGLSTARSIAHVITQALGQGPPARPDVEMIELEPGDRFLLCSDGLSDVLGPAAITRELTRRAPARALVRLAYETGSRDNITALVVTAR